MYGASILGHVKVSAHRSGQLYPWVKRLACPGARLLTPSPSSRSVKPSCTKKRAVWAKSVVRFFETTERGDGLGSRACGRAKLLTHVLNGSPPHRHPTCAEIQSDRRSRDRARWPPGARARGSSPAAEKFADGAFSGPGSAPTRPRPHRDIDWRIDALSRPKPQPVTSRSQRLPPTRPTSLHCTIAASRC